MQLSREIKSLGAKIQKLCEVSFNSVTSSKCLLHVLEKQDLFLTNHFFEYNLVYILLQCRGILKHL